MKIRFFQWAFLAAIIILSCNRIKTGDKLSKADIERIKQLGLLDSNEQIIRFYSNMNNETTGYFYTDKRIAHYWIDKKENPKGEGEFAYYRDILSIDTVYYAGLTYSPFMRITTKEHDIFDVCADGKKKEIQAFFEEAIALWKRSAGKGISH